jgi:magnesium-transporting ATPase (P-type)
MQDRDVIVLPRKPDHVSQSRTARLTITKTLEFSSQTLRSGVVVMADDALPGSALLFIRGAPGIIKDLVQASSVPADFEQVRHRSSLIGNDKSF